MENYAVQKLLTKLREVCEFSDPNESKYDRHVALYK
jgi:hypothetical protein